MMLKALIKLLPSNLNLSGVPGDFVNMDCGAEVRIICYFLVVRVALNGLSGSVGS